MWFPRRYCARIVNNIKGPWADIERHPHLYRLNVTTNWDGGTDVKSERFGFREFSIRGHLFYLNGEPLKLGVPNLATGHEQMWAANGDMTDGTDPDEPYRPVVVRTHRRNVFKPYVENADEEGLMLKLEGVLGSVIHDWDSEETWAKFQQN